MGRAGDGTDGEGTRVEIRRTEIEGLLELWRDRTRHSADVKKRTLEKVAEIERHIVELQAMREQLLGLADSCPGDDSADCPIMDNLSGCCHRKAHA